jgi:sulfur-oxidizing protein SoxX
MRLGTIAIVAVPLLSFAVCVNAALAAGRVIKDHDLVPYTIVDGAIPQSLTGKPGDPVAGRKIVINRKLGNCLGCHVMPIPEQPDHGTVGTDLHGVGSRWSEGELRLRIVNPKVINPATVMPAFYRVDGLRRVAKKFQGKPILTAQQVEDVVAYLKTLKD